MKNGYGHKVEEGFFIDDQGFHYYHIKKTPKGFIKREANEEKYSSLDQTLASTLHPLNRQNELVRLIISVEKEKLSQIPTRFRELLKKQKASDILNLEL